MPNLNLNDYKDAFATIEIGKTKYNLYIPTLKEFEEFAQLETEAMDSKKTNEESFKLLKDLIKKFIPDIKDEDLNTLNIVQLKMVIEYAQEIYASGDYKKKQKSE